VIGGAVVASGVVFHATSYPAFNLAFSFLWLVGISNAFNLIDNMDGLCAGVAVIIAAFRFFLLAASGNWPDAWLCAAVGMAYGGFLFWNYRPARIFMGDCGSMLAGFVLAALTIDGPPAHTRAFAAGIFYPALTFTYPIFDTAFVSVLRKLAGRPISVGGRDHSSHRLVLAGLSESRTVWALWFLTATGSGIGLMAHSMPLGVAIAGGLLIIALAIFGIFLATLPVYPLPVADPLERSWMRGRIPSLRAGVILILDVALAGIALLMAFVVRFGQHLPAAQVRNLSIMLPIAMLIHAGLCCYNRVFALTWTTLGARDLLALARNAGISAICCAVAIRVFGLQDQPVGLVAQYFVLCAAGAIAIRCALALLPSDYKVERRITTTPNCMTVPYAPGRPSENLITVTPVRNESPS
jgi:UDP-GlcNAc:undecaprenyl-phosphate GlcNAc-1-phosphate transferase